MRGARSSASDPRISGLAPVSRGPGSTRPPGHHPYQLRSADWLASLHQQMVGDIENFRRLPPQPHPRASGMPGRGGGGLSSRAASAPSDQGAGRGAGWIAHPGFRPWRKGRRGSGCSLLQLHPGCRALVSWGWPLWLGYSSWARPPRPGLALPGGLISLCGRVSDAGGSCASCLKPCISNTMITRTLHPL